MIAIAGSGEFTDRISHYRKFSDLCLDLGHMLGRKPLYIRAGAPLVPPEINKQTGALDREPRSRAAFDRYLAGGTRIF
jgi:hypothetical protein